MIKYKNGNIIEGREETKRSWTEYCIGLYSNSENNNELGYELEKITPPQNEEEIEEADYEEVGKSVKLLNKNKSQGTDGITNKFYIDRKSKC